jgi:hypothetical protein
VNRAHYLAVFDRLEEDAALDGRGYESARVNVDGTLVRDTYWILWGGSPSDLGGDRLFKSQEIDDNAVFDFTVRSVSPTVEGVFAESQKVQDQLVGWVPDIAGRRCRKVRLSGSDKVKADNSVKPPLFYVDDEFELRSYFTTEES